MISVLFIGNSHTYFNDMPEIVRQLALADGVDMRVCMLTKGGMGLKYHAENQQSRFNLLFGQHDFVVLQHCAHPMGDMEEFYEGARKLVAFAREGGVRPILYMTWAAKGDEEYQGTMSAAYTRLGEELGVTVAPVGEVWQEERLIHPEVELYYEDGAHASLAGSRLAAKVIYDAICALISTPKA